MDLWIDPEGDAVVLDELWPDHASLSAPTLALVLESAQDQCTDYAPKLAADAEVPARYKAALLMQARAVYRSLLAGSGDTIGPDGLTVTVYPMDRTVKALLRPPRPRRAL